MKSSRVLKMGAVLVLLMLMGLSVQIFQAGNASAEPKREMQAFTDAGVPKNVRGDSLGGLYEGQGRTTVYYSGAVTAATNTAAGDMVILKGSPTKKVRVVQFCVSGIGACAETRYLQLIKRSAVTGATTPVAVGITPVVGETDQSYTGAAVVLNAVTSAVTPGTAIGVIDRFNIIYNVWPQTTPTAQAQGVPVCRNLLDKNGSGLILEGAAENLCLYGNFAASVCGGDILYWSAITQEYTAPE